MQVEFIKVVQIATPVLIAGLGWALKIVLGEVRSLRGEMKEQVSKELCEAHRLTMKQEIHHLEELFKKQKAD